MARPIAQFQIDLMIRLVERGRQQARDFLLSGRGAHTSKYLANEMQALVLSPTEGILYSDPYWALYFHDGRGPIVKGKGALVWYDDPKQDPRNNGGYTPHRASQLRRLRLSKDEFKRLRESGEIIVSKTSGPVAPTPYFSNKGGMAGFKAIAAQIVREEMDRYMQEIIAELGEQAEIELRIDA